MCLYRNNYAVCGSKGIDTCVHNDDNLEIREAILLADMIVFATPLYYYGMSAQLKMSLIGFVPIIRALLANK